MNVSLTSEEQAAYSALGIDPAIDLQAKVDERLNQWKRRQADDLSAAIMTLNPDAIDTLAEQVAAATEAARHDVAEDVPTAKE